MNYLEKDTDAALKSILGLPFNSLIDICIAPNPFGLHQIHLDCNRLLHLHLFHISNL